MNPLLKLALGISAVAVGLLTLGNIRANVKDTKPVVDDKKPVVEKPVPTTPVVNVESEPPVATTNDT